MLHRTIHNTQTDYVMKDRGLGFLALLDFFPIHNERRKLRLIFEANHPTLAPQAMLIPNAYAVRTGQQMTEANMIKSLTNPAVFLSSAFSGALLALVSSGAAKAELLKPISAQTIDFGATHGSAYYTPEKDGYRVVATIANGDATPVRFDTILAEGQSAKVSVPATIGQPEIAIIFTRMGGQLNVETSQPADAVTASVR